MMLFLCALALAQFAKAGDPFYYESISNPSKTLNYIIGFYSNDFTISRASDDKDYIAYAGAVINKSSTTLKWSDYYMIVKKKDGDLVFSYETAATSGPFACSFEVAENETHHVKFCFHNVFKTDEIADVYLFDKSVLKAFHLVYSKE